MPHIGGSKSIGTLMNEMAKDGIEPTRAEIFILTHKKRKDGRPLDEDSAKIVDMMQEKLNNDATSNERSSGSVAWEGDVYSQMLGAERSGYVHGLGLGPTPSLLWGTKSFVGNIATDKMSNEVVQRLEQEIKELKEKHNGEMNLMKSELAFMRQLMWRLIPAKLFGPQNFNGSSVGQVPDANSGHEQAPQTS